MERRLMRRQWRRDGIGLTQYSRPMGGRAAAWVAPLDSPLMLVCRVAYQWFVLSARWSGGYWVQTSVQTGHGINDFSLHETHLEYIPMDSLINSLFPDGWCLLETSVFRGDSRVQLQRDQEWWRKQATFRGLRFIPQWGPGVKLGSGGRSPLDWSWRHLVIRRILSLFLHNFNEIKYKIMSNKTRR